MTSRLLSSLVRCSIPRVSFIYISQFYSTTPLISRTLILRNLFSKPCCAISIKSASSTSLASENDMIKSDDKNLLCVLESVIAEKNLKKVLPKDFQFKIIDNLGDGLIKLKREYGSEQIKADLFMKSKSTICLVVTIDKEVGSTLEFWCSITPNDFKIGSFLLKSSKSSLEYSFRGPVSCDSDERLQSALQSAFQEYLGARGFKKSHYDYLYFLVNRNNSVLQSLKEFIEK